MKNIFIKPFILISVVYLIFFAFQQIVFSKKLASNIDYKYPAFQHIQKTSKKADVVIKFDFIQYGWIGSWDNLFQTSKSNEGIRLEMARGSEDSGRWALVFFNNEKTLTGRNLGKTPPMNQWHKFKVKVKDKNVKVWLDSNIIFDGVLKNITYSLDDIAVGTGFSKERPFNGEIKNFSLSVTYSPKYLKFINFIFLQMWIILFFLLSLNIPSKMQKSVSSLTAAGIYVLLTIITVDKIWPFTEVSLNLFLCWDFAAIVLIASYFMRKKFSLKFLPCIAICAIFFVYLNSFFFPLTFTVFWGYFFAVIAFGFLIAAVIASLKSIKLKKAVYALSSVFIFIVFLFSVFGAIYLYKAGNTGLRMDEMSAFFQSNAGESFEFLTSFFLYYEIFIFFAVAFTITYLFVVFVKDASKAVNARLFKFSGAFFIASILFFCFSNPEKSFYYNILMAKNDYARITGEFKKYKEMRDSVGLVKAEKETKGELYFIVIGEASNPRHWSAYGYFRDTAPWALKERTENENAVFFNSVYSSHVHTVPSLIKALTSANQYNQANDFTSPSIIEVAKAAGFKAHWLSNQDKISLVDNPLTVLAEGSDTTVFTNVSRFGTDEALLPLIEKTLNSINTEDNNLIIIHLLGSHAKYKKRIPKKFHIDFNGTEEYLGNNAKDNDFINNILNPYDNTIAFTDSILKNIYAQFQSMPNPVKLLLFFSDHGEDVYGKKFHNSSMFTYEMARIPMFMIFSEEYKKNNEEKIKTLKSRTNSVFTLDLLFNLANGILGINTPLNDKKYDLSAAEYSINIGNALTMYADDTFQENLYKRTEALNVSGDPDYQKKKNMELLLNKYPDKFFGAHGATAIGSAYQALYDGFKSIEIDVTAPNLKMGHGPDKVYNMNLDEFLDKIPLNNINKLWIDVKELDAADIDNIINILNELDEKFKIKEKSLIEAPLMNPDMKKFTENGWRYSFYFYVKANANDVQRGFSHEINTLILKKDPSKEDEARLKELAAEIAAAAIDQKASGISFAAYLYPFVKQYIEPLLPKTVLYNVFGFNSLSPITSPNAFEDLSESKIINDKRVNFILLTAYSRFF